MLKRYIISSARISVVLQSISRRKKIPSIQFINNGTFKKLI